MSTDKLTETGRLRREALRVAPEQVLSLSHSHSEFFLKGLGILEGDMHLSDLANSEDERAKAALEEISQRQDKFKLIEKQRHDGETELAVELTWKQISDVIDSSAKDEQKKELEMIYVRAVEQQAGQTQSNLGTIMGTIEKFAAAPVLPERLMNSFIKNVTEISEAVPAFRRDLNMLQEVLNKIRTQANISFETREALNVQLVKAAKLLTDTNDFLASEARKNVVIDKIDALNMDPARSALPKIEVPDIFSSGNEQVAA